MNKTASQRFSELETIQLDGVAGGLRLSQLEHFGSRVLSQDGVSGTSDSIGGRSDFIDLDRFAASSVVDLDHVGGSTTTSAPRADFVIVGSGGAHTAGSPGAGSVATTLGGAGAHGAPGFGTVINNGGGVGTSGWGSYSSALSGMQHGAGMPGASTTTTGGGGFSFWHTPATQPMAAGNPDLYGTPGATSVIVNGQPIGGTGTGLVNGLPIGTGTGIVNGLPIGTGTGIVNGLPIGVGTGIVNQTLPGTNNLTIAHAPPAPTTRIETGLAADVSLDVDWTAGFARGVAPGGGIPGIPGGTIPFQQPPRNEGGGGFFGLFDDPLLLDLDNNGVQLTSVQDGVMFDINGDGQQERVAWTQSGDRAEAWLVRDDSHDGGQAGIQSGRELFGDQHGDPNGFARLATYDSNNDGVFNAQDDAFDEMQLWRDRNHNGISEAGEMVSLADEGIVSINVTPTSTEQSQLGNNNRAIFGSFTREVPI